MMRNKNKKITTYFILFSLLLIGIIYAILQANLQINGIAKIKSNSWDIHFDNVQINENSVSIGTGDSAATIDSENNCKVDFSVNLSLPGDFYEFTVDVVNSGTIDAMIGTLTKILKVNNEVVSEVPDYLNYSITYANGAEIIEKHILSAGATETYLVRLEFKTDIEELPSTATIETSLEPQYIQADDTATNVPFSLYNVFKTEVDNNSGLVHEYTGTHKDSFTQTGTKKIYHWYADNDANANTILDKWNVLFGGFCWQAYRTTDTGGVKLIYNGELSPLYNKEYTSPDIYNSEHEKNIFTFNTSDSTWNYAINDSQEYEIGFKVTDGDNYSLDISATLTSYCGFSSYITKNGVSDSGPSTGAGQPVSYTYSFGSLSSSDELKYTIFGGSTNCTINLKINMKQGSRKLSKDEYSMLVEKSSGDYGCDNKGDSQQIERNSFNSSYYSLAYEGYMIPDSSKRKTYAAELPTSGVLFGTGVNYSGGSYTLTNTSTTYDSTHHYTCNNIAGTCPTVRYYFNDSIYYIELDGEEDIEEVINNMLSSDDVNQDDSTIKATIDTWYQNNMTSYTSKLEDTIFCNDRSISSLGGWNPNGGPYNEFLQFKNYTLNSDLSCTNKTDQFSLSNSFAQLTYPVGLMTSSEANILNNKALRSTGKSYWLMSPFDYSVYGEFGRYVDSIGNMSDMSFYNWGGVRPVIALKSGTLAISGDGSKNNPYVVS